MSDVTKAEVEQTEPVETYRGYVKTREVESGEFGSTIRLTLATMVNDQIVGSTWVIPQWELDMATFDLEAFAWDHLADRLDHRLDRSDG